MAIQQKWLTVEEAAKYLRVSKRTIYQLCKEGRLISYRSGNRRHRRFQKADLDKVLQKDRTHEGFLALSAATDPVLAELWDNERDAAYDQL